MTKIKKAVKKIANKKENTRRFVGIADCHGVESFIPLKSANLSALGLRAEANPQRHAVVYSVDLTDGYVDKVYDSLETAKHSDNPSYHYKYIVRMFKAWANDDGAINKGLGLPPVNLKTSSKKKWNNIPNSKLDPYYKANDYK